MTAAALRLGLNQSTVSHTVDKLRLALKDPLFVRVGRNIVPTSYAASLEPRVRTVLADLYGLPKSEEFDPAFESGFISLAANVTEFSPELVILRDRLRRLAPRIKFRILELGSRENVEQVLAKGEVDVALTVRKSHYPPELMHRGIISDQFSVFYDPELRSPVRSVEEYCAAEHGTLDFGGTKPSTIELILRERSMQRTVALRVPNAYNLAHFIKGTAIICTMQTRLHNSVFSQLAQCPVPFDVPGVNFDMVWHRRENANPRNTWLRAIVQEAITPPPEV